MYAICSKIDGVIKYLNRYETNKYNSSSLEAPMRVYEFGEICNETVYANSEDWVEYLTSGGLHEIIEHLRTSIDVNNFPMAFVKIEKTVTYDTTICKAFRVKAEKVDEGVFTYSTLGLNPDGFC